MEKHHGRGRLTYANGDVYQGDWVAGRQEGTGVFVNRATATVYDGTWVDGMKHGNGRESQDRGTHIVTYVGEF